MESNRRKFLQMAGIAPAAAVTGGLASAASAPKGGVALTREAFSRCTGQRFVFSESPVESVGAKLVEIEALRNAKSGIDDGRSFRLLFEADQGASLKQMTYRVEHAQFGSFAMFVSPNDVEGRVAEAIFNVL